MLKDHSLSPRLDSVISLSGMGDEELLSLRSRIDDRLNIELKHVNLTEELGLQYRAGKLLLDQTQGDESVPANQKAQVSNSVSAMLSSIVKMQETVYSIDRLKRYEAAFLKSVETLPKENKEAFFDLYGEFLANKGA